MSNEEKAKDCKLEGNKFLKEKKFEKGVEKYSEGLSLLDKKDGDLHLALLNNRAQAYIFLKKYKEAINDCKKILTVDTKNQKAYYRLQNSYYQSGAYLECIETFQNFNKKNSQLGREKTRKYRSIHKICIKKYVEKLGITITNDMKIFEVIILPHITCICFTIGFMSNNSYVLFNNSNDVILIDATFNTATALKTFTKNKQVHVFQTHGHIDHIFDIFLWGDNKAKIYAHEKERSWLDLKNKENWKVLKSLMPIQVDLNQLFEDPFILSLIQKQYHIRLESAKVTNWLKGGELLKIANNNIEVLHTPGHSLGSICFYMKDSGFLFTGDTLFVETIGRVDLPGGSWEIIQKSIREKIYTLPDNTMIFPGHPTKQNIFLSNVGHEKKYNKVRPKDK